MRIRVRYLDPELVANESLQLGKIGGILEGRDKSNWIDVRASNIKRPLELVEWGDDKSFRYDAGDDFIIGLGFALELPTGYEAYLAPRSSMFRKYGLILTNSVGVIDESYCGDTDEWMMHVYALRSGEIHKNDRIGQMRIMPKMPNIIFESVDSLGNRNRGGFGSTGTK